MVITCTCGLVRVCRVLTITKNVVFFIFNIKAIPASRFRVVCCHWNDQSFASITERRNHYFCPYHAIHRKSALSHWNGFYLHDGDHPGISHSFDLIPSPTVGRSFSWLLRSWHTVLCVDQTLLPSLCSVTVRGE